MRQQWKLEIHALLQHIIEIAQLQEMLHAVTSFCDVRCLTGSRKACLVSCAMHSAMPIEKRMVSNMPFASPATVARHYEQIRYLLRSCSLQHWLAVMEWRPVSEHQLRQIHRLLQPSAPVQPRLWLRQPVHGSWWHQLWLDDRSVSCTIIIITLALNVSAMLHLPLRCLSGTAEVMKRYFISLSGPVEHAHGMPYHFSASVAL